MISLPPVILHVCRPQLIFSTGRPNLLLVSCCSPDMNFRSVWFHNVTSASLPHLSLSPSRSGSHASQREDGGGCAAQQ